MKLNDDMVGLHVVSDLVEQPKAMIVINHGFAEHIGRYDWVVEQFNKHGFSTVRYDVKEHGDSTGKISSYQEFIADLRGVVLYAKGLHSDIPVYNLGHSMGGLITALFGLEFGELVDGQILSGPALGKLPAVSGIKSAFLSLVAKFAPDKLIKNVVGDAICTDPKVVEAYNSDPKVLTHARAEFLREFTITAPEYLLNNMKSYDCDVLVLHGSDDSIVPVTLSKTFIKTIASIDKELIMYDGYYHEILNEPIKQDVMNDILNWLNKRIEEK